MIAGVIIYLLLGICLSIIDRIYIARTPQLVVMWLAYWLVWPWMLVAIVLECCE